MSSRNTAGGCGQLRATVPVRFRDDGGKRTADIRELEELGGMQDFEEKLLWLHSLWLANGKFDGNYSLEEALQLLRRRKSAVLNVKIVT